MEKEQTSKEFAINLFLRTIGAEKFATDKEVMEDLSNYIGDKFKTLGCCVLWFKSLEDSSSKLCKILKKHNIQFQTNNVFSIILRGHSVLFSDGHRSVPKLVFKGTENDTSLQSKPSQLSKNYNVPEDIRDWIY